jgi:uncharacterized protein (TIGR02118 family)
LIKFIGFVKRRKDFTFEQFRQYWLEHHSVMEKRMVETTLTRKTKVSFVIPPDDGSEPPWDAMYEIYYDSLADLKEQFRHPERRAPLAKDEENFIDTSQTRVRIVAEEEFVTAQR